jgi:hypothetical protein
MNCHHGEFKFQNISKYAWSLYYFANLCCRYKRKTISDRELWDMNWDSPVRWSAAPAIVYCENYEIVILYSCCKYNGRNSLKQYVTTVNYLRFALMLIIAIVYRTYLQCIHIYNISSIITLIVLDYQQNLALNHTGAFSLKTLIALILYQISFVRCGVCIYRPFKTFKCITLHLTIVSYLCMVKFIFNASTPYSYFF